MFEFGESGGGGGGCGNSSGGDGVGNCEWKKEEFFGNVNIWLMRWWGCRFAWGRSCEYVFEDVGDAVWVAGVWCAGMSRCP